MSKQSKQDFGGSVKIGDFILRMTLSQERLVNGEITYTIHKLKRSLWFQDQEEENRRDSRDSPKRR